MQGCTRHCICEWSGGEGRGSASLLYIGAFVLKGAMVRGAGMLLCSTANPKYGVELFVNFFPNLFILGTASPFYAAR